MMRLQVSGSDRLADRLRNGGAKVREAAEETVAAETVSVAEDMRTVVPVLSGELRDSIASEADGLSGRAMATARHAEYVEFGTSSAEAQPFAQPTAEQHRGPYRDRMAAAINEKLGRP